MYRIIFRGITVECDDIATVQELIDHLSGPLPAPVIATVPVVKNTPKKNQGRAVAKKATGGRGTTRDAILAALDRVAPATSAEIIEESGLKNTQVFAALHLLKASGVVRRNEDGKYDRVRG